MYVFMYACMRPYAHVSMHVMMMMMMMMMMMIVVVVMAAVAKA